MSESTNKKDPDNVSIAADPAVDAVDKPGEIDPGTFVVRIRHHQNDTFQGSITWAEKDRTEHFRSTWEMVRMIEDALLGSQE